MGKVLAISSSISCVDIICDTRGKYINQYSECICIHLPPILKSGFDTYPLDIKILCIFSQSLNWFQKILPTALTNVSLQVQDNRYCECRNFRAIHIFALFAFLKYPQKYVHRENNFYYTIKEQ